MHRGYTATGRGTRKINIGTSGRHEQKNITPSVIDHIAEKKITFFVRC